jgi:DNA-binding transcriptional MerR regulator
MVKKFLREPELAEMLGVSDRTVREWRYLRLIPYFKVNRVISFDPDRVREALKRFGKQKATRAGSGRING